MGGRDKGLLPLAGRPLAAHLVAALRPQVGELLINANRNQASYAALHNRVVSDSFGVFCGPLAGLLAALETAVTPYVVSVPCDSPLIPPDYVEILYAALQRERAELSVAWDGLRLQPVFLLLRRELTGSLRAFLEPGGRKIDAWFAGHRLARADFSAWPQMFRNVNTPEELAMLEAEWNVGPVYDWRKPF
jgi:molybdenum cofactor guanylyltransferase